MKTKKCLVLIACYIPDNFFCRRVAGFEKRHFLLLSAKDEGEKHVVSMCYIEMRKRERNNKRAVVM